MAESFDSLLALLQRTTDAEGWLSPMRGDPDSAAILGARITIFARLGPAVDHNGAQGLLSAASGGTPGTCQLAIARAATGTTGTIPEGYPFVDARGVRATLQADVVIGSGVTAASLPLATDRQTELVNSEDDPGFVVAPDAPVIPGSSGILIAPAGTGGMTSTTFQSIGPSSPIEGGSADYLSVHGSEKGLHRQPGETVADYRQRIRNIPDAVTPIAIADVVQQAQQLPGLPAFLTLEPFSLGETPALKDRHGLGSFSGVFYDDYDGTNGDKGGFLDDFTSGDVMLDRRTATAYFEIRAQDYVRDPSGGVLFMDDAFLDDPVLGFPDIPGIAPETVAALLGIATHVSVLKAGGVQFDVLLKAPIEVTTSGTRSSAAFGAVANFTPPVGSIWSVEELIASHSGPDPAVGVDHYFEFDLEGGGLFSTAVFSKSWSERVPVPSARVTAIRGYLRSNGSMVANLAATARVVEVVL